MQMGDYMGEGDDWSKSVLYAYVDQMSFQVDSWPSFDQWLTIV